MDNKIKSKTRIAAVQVIFQFLSNGKNTTSIQDEFNKYYRNKKLGNKIEKIEYNVNFLSKLIDYYTLTSLNFNFESKINKYLKFDRLFEKWDLINKSIMMMAISELINTDRNKRKIIINEYIELSKKFIHSHEIKIINAILDKFMNEDDEDS